MTIGNSIETVEVDGGVVWFDHSTGVMRAKWDNGYTETWPRRGYSISTMRDAFYRFVGMYDRMMEDA